jgi:SpoVK/Ycf46/Vps4 family AAA+-type ATPase
MDGCGNNLKEFLVIGATNKPWELDDALRNKFELIIQTHLPDQ